MRLGAAFVSLMLLPPWESPKPDKICVMTTRLACIELLRARIGEWNNNLSDGFQLGYVTLPVTDVEPDMDLDEFSP